MITSGRARAGERVTISNPAATGQAASAVTGSGVRARAALMSGWVSRSSRVLAAMGQWNFTNSA